MHLIGVLDAPSGPLSFVIVLTWPLMSPFALGADGVLLVVVSTYLVAVSTYCVGSRRRAGEGKGECDGSVVHWPVWRSAAFVGGALLVFTAVGSGLARYQSRPSVLVVQHVLLMMAAPPLLVVGLPVGAWRAPRRRAPEATTRPSVRSTTPLYYAALLRRSTTPLYYAALLRLHGGLLPDATPR